MYLRGDTSILVPAVFSEIVAILTAPAVYLQFFSKNFFSVKPLYFDQNSLDCKFEHNFLVCLLFR